VYDGQRAVKSKGEKYLPSLSEQTSSEYEAYKQRALFYSITSKSVGAMVGMAMSKRPILKYPPEMSSYFEDASGTQFYELTAVSLSENVLMGRYGVLVDRQIDGGLPQMHGYRAEAITNWRITVDGLPSLVVLTENVYDSNDVDIFDHATRLQYRVLRLTHKSEVPTNLIPILGSYEPDPFLYDPLTEMIYTVSVYDDKKQHIETRVPLNMGKPMSVIPFYVVNPFGLNFNTLKPPMLDIVDVNISHYCTSADLEHGRHFTGLPTAVVSGVDASTKLKIGSMTAWVLPDKDAKAQYLEFTGQGLQSLEKAMKEKEAQLASLSASVLDNSHNGSEAPDTVRLRYMADTASLASIVRGTEALLNTAYKMAASMNGIDPALVHLQLNKEFLESKMSASELIKLTESYLTGGMSVESYVYNLRRGDQLPVTRTDDEEISALNKLKADKLAAAQAAKPVIQPQNQN